MATEPEFDEGDVQGDARYYQRAIIDRNTNLRKGESKMAVVLKSKGGSSSKIAPAKVAPAPKPNLSLPTKLSEPKTSMLDYSWLIYGEKKIGKTSLCAQFPGAFFLMCEPGGKGLRIFQKPVAKWTDLTGYLDLLEKGGHGFKTVVVDTVDKCYERCWEFMLKKLCIEHPHDENDFGKSWGLIEGEFVRQMTRLLNLPMGTVFISHAAEKEVKTLEGEKFDRIEPTMANQAKKFLTGIIDTWAYYGYAGGSRQLVLDGDDFIGAGTRLQENFRFTDGSRVRRIDMGSGPAEAFSQLREAFENKLEAPEPLKKKLTISKK